MAIEKKKLERIIELRSDGVSIRQIATEVHLDRDTVSNYLQKNQELVQAIHGIKLDELIQRRK